MSLQALLFGVSGACAVLSYLQHMRYKRAAEVYVAYLGRERDAWRAQAAHWRDAYNQVTEGDPTQEMQSAVQQ